MTFQFSVPHPEGKLEVKTLLFAPLFAVENLSGVKILMSNPVISRACTAILRALPGHLKLPRTSARLISPTLSRRCVCGVGGGLQCLQMTGA